MLLGSFYAYGKTSLHLFNSNCINDKCDIDIKDQNNESKGQLFIAKKINEDIGTSIYTVEIKNLMNKKENSFLITCLKNYTCKVYSYEDNVKADYAFANDRFYSEIPKNAFDISKNRQENSQNKIKINHESVNIYAGNNEILIDFPY